MVHGLLLILYIIIGIAVGALTGITGSSGVLIVVPALSFIGFNFKEAIGSSLLVDVITTSSVTFVYFKNRNVNAKISTFLGLGAIIGAQLGAAFAFITPSRLLQAAFIVFTSYMAYISYKRSRNPRLNVKRRLNIRKELRFILAFALSLLIGFVTGTLGASGGIMFIALMMLLFEMDIKQMIGTATLAMFLSATSGGIAYSLSGKAILVASLIIGASALISGYYFAKIANKMRASTIYLFLGSVFLLTSISELVRFL
ncbi:MAG: sulfite exporter TauE/SafE family protein [Sulfolobaceae archaeon]|nr:sulfite exporter TauE/SafE family protein [Sulfolobaceae archaeon]